VALLKCVKIQKSVFVFRFFIEEAFTKRAFFFPHKGMFVSDVTDRKLRASMQRLP